jgi:hypothetical protein
MMRISFVTTAVITAMGVANLMWPAHASAGILLDNWTSPVNVTTSNTAAFQPTFQFDANIYDAPSLSPDPAVFGIVSRKATVSQPYASPVSGLPYSEALTQSVGTEQRLFFKSYDNGGQGNGQVALEYQFGITGGIALPGVAAEVANFGVRPITVALFTQKTGTTSWFLGDYDPFDPGTPFTNYFFSTHTSNNISGLMVVYNPLNSLLASYSFVDSGGNAILHTALPFMTNAEDANGAVGSFNVVPEPSSMVFGFIGLGLSVVVYRKRNMKREQVSAAT